MSKTVVDSGAFQLAINVLRRAGKDEVADELEKSGKVIDREPIGYIADGDLPLISRCAQLPVHKTQHVGQPNWPVFLGIPSVHSKRIGHFHVTVDDNAVTISDGARIMFAYDGDSTDNEPIGEYAHYNKQYASAIGNAAIKSGIYRKDLEGMTGPMLLMACDDMAECINSITAQLGLAAYTLHQVQTLLVNEVNGADAGAKTWPLLRLKTVTDTVDAAIEKIDPRGDWKTSVIIDDNHPIAKGPNHEQQ